ncbi:hypothetical protein HanPSC8_Chr01g0037191 [Helianthus annuus]|nr:hypothetical protein HanPSC8_Chr01g0037191 [Helianthus annuus]
MEQKRLSCGLVCDQLSTLSVKYPWLVAQNLEDDTKDQIFYTMHDPLSRYRCQIPELFGRCIRGCFHGWVILSSNHPHNVMWSLWNPVTSKTICLPPLVLKDGDFESIKQCCLSSPPSDPTSVLMLTRTKTPTIVFCRLDRKRKRLRWKEMTYAKQLRSITGDDGFLHCLTCCNGKVFALSSGGRIVIQFDIVVKDKEVVISLLAFGKLPLPFNNGCSTMKSFLRGFCNDLFHIKLGFDDEMAKTTPGVVYLYKLDVTNMIWEEMEDLKDAIFFLDLAHDCSVFYRDAIAQELGGYIHILGEVGSKVIYSYDVKDKTISLSSMSYLEQSTRLSLWECWLHGGDQGEIECGTDFKPADEIMEIPVRDDKVDISDTRNEETHILNIPPDVLRTILTEFCGCVEYLNFRATCKHFQLAAPIIRWSEETSLRRSQIYSLNSPWLLVFDKHRGIITFTDPMFGDKYFIKTPQKLIGDLRIYCSRYGWLLLYKLNGPGEMFFFNPFTKDIHELPNAPYLDSLFFLAPPTSPNCMVAGLSASLPMNFFIYSLTSESSSWARYRMGFGDTTPHSFLFSTIFATCTFALNQGALNLISANDESNVFWNAVVAEAPRGSIAQYYLANCNEHLLLVVMDDELGENVEVLEMKFSTQEWVKIDSIGRHMICISGTTCFCMEAKTPEMENKIYFPRLHSKYGNIVFYSLETRRYHTFNGRNIIEECLKDFIGTKYHVYPHAWIQPSWS